MSTLSVTTITTADGLTDLTAKTGNASAGFIVVDSTSGISLGSNSTRTAISINATGGVNIPYTVNTNAVFAGSNVTIDSGSGGYIFVGSPEQTVLNTTATTTSTNLTVTGTSHSISGNVNVDAGTLFVDGVNGRVGVGNTAPAVTFHVTGTANMQGNVNIGGTSHAITGNLNVDAGVLFVDGVNNRLGINNTAPAVPLHVTGAANVTGNLAVSGNATFLGNLFNLGSSTLATNGYAWLPTGIKMNWGVVIVNTTSVATYTSPFATATLSVQLTPIGTAFIGANTVRVVAANTTAAQVRSTSTTTTNTCYYLAIGY